MSGLSKIYEGASHIFTAKGDGDEVIIKPGYNETLQLGGSIYITDLPGNEAALYINDVPVSVTSSTTFTVRHMSIWEPPDLPADAPTFTVVNPTSDGTSVEGNDFAGVLFIQVSESIPSLAGKLATLTFHTPYSQNCLPFLSFGVFTTANTLYYKNNTTTSFEIWCKTAPELGDIFNLSYLCVEKYP